ncbi:hypothetical protein MMC18_007475, partial [Xylographa bjoerkii]|nr:hypothetical protein [Xylographa bjoerkii]
MSSTKSDGKIVLVSGINGYIASTIGLDLLKKGYTLRGTSRSAHSADALLKGAYKDYVDRVQMVSVPDMTIPGAFDEAVKGVTAVIHTASPIDFSLDHWDHFVPIAVAGAAGILLSAYKHAGPQLESFVLTSSVAAIVDPSKKPYDFTEADWNTYSGAKAKELGDKAPGGLLYQASKTEAERAIWAFRDEYKPSFSISAVNPGVVVGPPVQPPPTASALNETLKPTWAVFSGSSPTLPAAIGSASYVDVRDVAAMHVWCAEHPTESNGQRYLMANGRGTPQAAADILRKAYPHRKEIPVGEPGSDYEEGYGWPEGGQSFDSAKAKKALGREFMLYDQSILDTAKVFERYL